MKINHEAFIIRNARGDDLPAIQALLQSLKLPTQGVQDHLPNFLVMVMDGQIIGTVGLEIYRRKALLRSLAIARSFQGKKLGLKLYQSIMEKARQQQITDCYLLTETAEEYFHRLGFRVIDRSEANDEVKKSEEFRTACPASATCMWKSLT
ncbi:MAG: hypothetical protein Kow0042_22300 [Calditrichia bacterium]